jgi:hypothetical protein
LRFAHAKPHYAKPTLRFAYAKPHYAKPTLRFDVPVVVL